MKIDQGWFNDTFERVVNVDQIINKNEPSLVLVIGDLSANNNPIWFSVTSFNLSKLRHNIVLLFRSNIGLLDA